MRDLTTSSCWRPGAAAGEALANLRARPLRFLLLCALVAVVVGVLLLSELAVGRKVTEDKRRFLRAGGTVAVATVEAGALPAERCLALSRQAHVVAAGGLVRGGTVRSDTAPSTPFQEVRAYGDALVVLDPRAGRDPQPGLVVALAAAEELGVAKGSRLSIGGTERRVGAIVNPVRDESLSRSIIIPSVAQGTVQECWIEFQDGALDGGVRALHGWFDVDGLKVRQLMGRNDASRDFAAEWLHRPLRSGWIFSALVIVVFLLLVAWRRRSEYTLYVLLGAPWRAVAAIQALEMWSVVTCGGVLGILWAVFVGTASGPPSNEVLLHGLRSAFLCLTAVFAAIVPTTGWLLHVDHISLLKDRTG